MSSHPGTRSSTPVRLYSSRIGSSSRTHLPPPKVLPFPDLPVRPTMSREHSRASSPLASPPLSSPPLSPPSTSYLGGATSSISPVSSSGNLAAQNPNNASTSRLAQSVSPSNPSPLGLTSPRPTRPRAATTIAAVSALSRQDGFQPASRPSTPTPLVTPVNATVSTAAPASASSSANETIGMPISRPSDPAPAEIITQQPTPSKKTSNPPGPLPASIPVTQPPPPAGLVEHLHRSLRTGACADVRIWVRKWGVAWHVHKMVLIQAEGFFHSLFTGGFSEMAPVRRTAKGKERAVTELPDDTWSGEDIELTFDDPNITRAAFEICLFRLYSPYPQLHFPVSLLPTATQPLTPSFPSGAGFPSLQKTYNSAAPNTHLVTPRLLLSLLATATYLGHQYLLREALAIVLRTVGPTSVSRYLNFAIGVGIGEEEWEGQDEHGALGMEEVARPIAQSFTAEPDSDWISESEGSEEYTHHRVHRESTDSTASDDATKVGGEATQRESPSRSASMRSTTTVRADGSHGPSMDEGEAPVFQFYGFVSNKIGEACVCWLTRWGLDILNIETAQPEQLPGTYDAPAVWGHGGIPAKFAYAVLSSDALFVPSEMERYTMCRRVLELRRAAWMSIAEEDAKNTTSTIAEPESIEGWEEDEHELAQVFAEGIYYSHMTFDDLSSISSDIDPTTALPYAPLAVLQAAHWTAADLKTRITNDRASPTATEGELGLTATTSEISSTYTRRRTPRSRMSSPYHGSPQGTVSFSSMTLSSMGYTSPAGTGVYHPVPSDDTHRIGAGGLLFLDPNRVAAPLPGIPGMPDMGPEWEDDKATKGKLRPPPQGERTFFGIMRGIKSGPEIDAIHREAGDVRHIVLPGLDKGKEERWSKVEPYRFSVEFWGVDKLADKGRLYSGTHFYAGSYFNVYVSTIRKKDKGVQLGIYLHRQSTAEPFPPANAVPSGSSPMITTVPFEPVSRAVTLPTAGTDMYRTMSTSQPVVGSPGPGIASLPDMEEKPREGGNYLDPRPVTKAYFSISCASALGTALVRFSSAPDSFAVSQSWGWKSSALRSEEYLSVPVPAEGNSVLGWVGESGEGGSLRATIVVGVI